MDNVTHTLVGVRWPGPDLRGSFPEPRLLMILAANIPDIDIVTLSRGQLAYLENHRGYTHTLLALPFLALLCVALTALLSRVRMPWMKAGAAACVG